MAIYLSKMAATMVGSSFNVELNCKIGSQLLLLFENMGVRSLQYFIILSRFMSTFLRNNLKLLLLQYITV